MNEEKILSLLPGRWALTHIRIPEYAPSQTCYPIPPGAFEWHFTPDGYLRVSCRSDSEGSYLWWRCTHYGTDGTPQNWPDEAYGRRLQPSDPLYGRPAVRHEPQPYYWNAVRQLLCIDSSTYQKDGSLDLCWEDHYRIAQLSRCNLWIVDLDSAAEGMAPLMQFLRIG